MTGNARVLWYVEVLVETQGYRLFANRFTAAFNESAALCPMRSYST
jgi:hypothetical protein